MKRKVVTLLTLTCIAIATVGGCGKSALESDTGGTAAEQTAPNKTDIFIEKEAAAEDMPEESQTEDLVAEDQVVNATYDDPAHLGEWVEVKCGVSDDEEYEHESDTYGKAYIRITDVLGNKESKEYYREHIQGWESSWTNDTIGLNKVDMDEDGKTQWNVVKYEIHFPSDFSECATCYPNLDSTVLFYYAVGDDNINTVDDEDTKQTWTYGELYSLSSEMNTTIADREYEGNWQETHKIDEEYYDSGVRERGTLHSGWILFWTHMEPDQSFKIDVRPLSSALSDSTSQDYYDPHGARSVHDGSDTGKYIEIKLTEK